MCMLLLLSLQCLHKTPKILDHLWKKREKRDNTKIRNKERKRKITNYLNEVLQSMRHMTHFYYNMLLCVSAVGTLNLDGAVGGTTRGWVGAALHTRVYD